MMGRNAAVSLALAVAAAVLAAPAAAEDKARARDGGSSAARSSAVGARHHAPPSARSAPAGVAAFAGGSSRAVSAPLTDAQRRHPRAGTGTGSRRFGTRFVGGYGYWPYYGSRYHYGFGRSYGFWGYSPYYYSGYYGYAPYDYRYSRYGYGAGAVRVLVDPEKTRVYVDGYYAGVADDFDGLFQRLHIAPGRHDISLRLDGYRTQRFKIYVAPGQTLKLHHDMVRGSGEAEEVLGGPADYGRFEEDDLEYEDREEDAERGDRGTLRLDVTPGDASIYVNGAFRGTARELRSLRLPPGRHRVEIVRPGYRTEEREVELRRGESSSLSVDLERS